MQWYPHIMQHIAIDSAIVLLKSDFSFIIFILPLCYYITLNEYLSIVYLFANYFYGELPAWNSRILRDVHFFLYVFTKHLQKTILILTTKISVRPVKNTAFCSTSAAPIIVLLENCAAKSRFAWLAAHIIYLSIKYFRFCSFFPRLRWEKRTKNFENI